MDQPSIRRIENAPELIADELEKIYLAEVKAFWVNYDPKLFQQGYRTMEDELKVEGPLAPLSERYGLNCWEMLGYVAHHVGVLDKRQLRELFELRRNPDGAWDMDYLMAWLDRMGDWMIPGERLRYLGEPGSPRPQRGDIVMWNRDARHIAMATGRTGADGSPELYSFWHQPKYPLKWDEATESYATVTDAVQRTTIDELMNAMYVLRDKDGDLVYGEPLEIFFGRGPW